MTTFTYTAEIYMSMASDAYKEINGVRPRHLYAEWSTLSMEEMEQVYLALVSEPCFCAVVAEQQAEDLSYIASQRDWLTIS